MWRADSVRQGDLLTFEASASTFWDRGTSVNAKQMHEALPAEIISYLLGQRIKLVVLLCDPIRRHLSGFMSFAARSYREKLVQKAHHNHARIAAATFEPSAQDFHRHVLSGIMWFNRCRQKRHVRECLYYEPHLGQPRPWLSIGAYANHLKTWETHFSKDQILIVKAEDYYNRTADTLDAVFHFLELPAPEARVRDLIRTMRPSNVNPARARVAPFNRTIQVLESFFSEVNTGLDEQKKSFRTAP